MIKLKNCDCFDLLKTIEDNSIDLIATDPPYYRVKDASWDRQWPALDIYFGWLDKVCAEFARVLKPSGSVYMFADPYKASKIELLLGDYFRVLNHIVWKKNQGRHLGCDATTLRKFFPQTERIIFAESKDAKLHYEDMPGNDKIRKVLADAIKDAGISRKEVDIATGTQMSGHWFGRSQWQMPSLAHYSIIQGLVNHTLPDYEELKGKVRHARKQHSRYFSATRDAPWTDVWDFSPVGAYKGKHPCEKPLALMGHIIKTSSRPGGLVLDAFLGSGTTAIACKKIGRRFIGSEAGKAEFEFARKRLDNFSEKLME